MTMMHRLRAVHSFLAREEKRNEQDADGLGCRGPHQLAGQRQGAIQQLLARLNANAVKPVALQLQFAYYLFLCGDPASAAQVL